MLTTSIGCNDVEALSECDCIGFLVGHPLRVSQADTTVTVPVGLMADEVVISESQRFDLSPGGREMNVQLAYDRSLWEGARLSSWLMMRTEPGHDASAPNDYGVGLVFRMTYRSGDYARNIADCGIGACRL